MKCTYYIGISKNVWHFNTNAEKSKMKDISKIGEGGN